MLERSAVAAATDRLLADAGAGRGRALYVLGDAGLGKTASVNAACAAAAQAGFRVVLATADPMESMLPFGLMYQSVRALGWEPVPAAAGNPVSAVDARAGRFFGVLDWLEARVEGPLLLGFDDLHWADPDSLALLSFLVRRISELPVAVVAALRPWPSEAQDVASALTHDGWAALERLTPLSEAAAGVLLGAVAGRRLPDRVVSEAWVACAGNPFLLEQVGAALVRGEAGDLSERGGRQLAQALLLSRFAGLPSTGLQIARAGGVLGGRFRAEIAAELAGVSGGERDAALDALARSGLVRAAVDGGLEFVHPLLRQALYEDTSPPVRTRMHARAFGLLCSRGLSVHAAEHALRGEMVGDAEAVAVLSGSGRAALAAGALEVAASHLGGAADLAGDRAGTGLLLAWARALLSRGRSAETVAVCRRVLARGGLPVPDRVEALRMMGLAHSTTAAHDAASDCYEQATRVAEPDHPGLAAMALVDHALTIWTVAGPARALPLATRARDLARDADPTVRTRVNVAWGNTALQAGDRTGLDALAEAAEPLLADPAAHAADLSLGLAGTIASYAMCAAITERLDEAERAASLALSAARRLGAAQTLASLPTIQTYVLYRLGRLDEALAAIEQARTFTDVLPMNEPYVAVCEAFVQLHRGRLDECEHACRRGERTARPRGELYALLFLTDVEGQRRLREGDLSASDVYLETADLARRGRFNEPCAAPWGRHAVAAHVRSGRLEEAQRVVDWLERSAESLPCRWPRIAALTGRALIAEQAGHREDANTHFGCALELHKGLDLPLERVETLLDYGAFLRRGGQLTQARALLAEAASTAESTGAHWLAGLAARELTATGGRRRRVQSPEHLTPQEERIAASVATGKSNAEIARQLSISVNTVETHLRHIYAKFGVRSRFELATRINPRPGRP
ncbi:LuxR C-terminal-related transcriptional regulator [Dactylosporangium sp. NPDC051541]|uniref:helix-turn-helix transcriptional regulator n=1 Tax=Dactylosporangium sp. NPDC051541 TaxID=3363977 RepID=UPI00379A2C66